MRNPHVVDVVVAAAVVAVAAVVVNTLWARVKGRAEAREIFLRTNLEVKKLT